MPVALSSTWMRVWIAVLALTGCRGLFGLDDPNKLVDATNGEAGADLDALGRLCWGVDVDVCLAAPAQGTLMLTGSLSTDGADCMTSSKPQYCVRAARTLTVEALDVTGSRPLVLIASESLVVNGLLDASSKVTGRVGPGAMNATCGTFTTAPSFVVAGGGNGGGAGGGAGGSLLQSGGGGGNNVGGAVAGQPVLAPTGPVFRAGCPGQRGGHRTANAGAVGGLGGGAVYLVAGTRIEVTATGAISASGAAGSPGLCPTSGTFICAVNTDAAVLAAADAYGGAGGGSGGAITLDAPSIVNASRVYADGAGGGEGASRSQAGLAGKESTGTYTGLFANGAPGGTGGNGNGGDGGNGSFLTMRTGVDASPGISAHPGGGGGGGGGAGVIRVHGTASGSGTYSPQP